MEQYSIRVYEYKCVRIGVTNYGVFQHQGRPILLPMYALSKIKTLTKWTEKKNRVKSS